MCSPVHLPPPLIVCVVKPSLHSPETPHRCWDACLCVATVRKCHCWHLTRTAAPTQACLLATCGPASSAADTGSLVYSLPVWPALGLRKINQVSTIAFIRVFLTGSPVEKWLPCSCTGPAELPETTQSWLSDAAKHRVKPEPIYRKPWKCC